MTDRVWKQRVVAAYVAVAATLALVLWPLRIPRSLVLHHELRRARRRARGVVAGTHRTEAGWQLALRAPDGSLAIERGAVSAVDWREIDRFDGRTWAISLTMRDASRLHYLVEEPPPGAPDPFVDQAAMIDELGRDGVAIRHRAGYRTRLVTPATIVIGMLWVLVLALIVRRC